MVCISFVFGIHVCAAQELYVFTEPASNMAAKSIGVRLNNSLLKTLDKGSEYHLIPEIMVGVSKKIMVHTDVFFSNLDKAFKMDGASIYGKYRFFNVDGIQKHFRVSAYGRASLNVAENHDEAIDLTGHNSGWEGGVVATQLLHKVAVSSGVSFLHAFDNSKNKFIYGDNNRDAINYTLSVGGLILPKEYTSYKQTNLNLILEFLNQYNVGSGSYYIDVAPAMQLIFNSKSRLDVGYRTQLSSTLYRSAPNGFFVRLEYNFFNAF
ncbi:MAG: hypothetical protein H0W12_09070 [Chitinophagaceae bacterium]|nr:hypothetical protein [Chitinophagaceae bacterium]